MYYPVGWHKVLKLDIPSSNAERCSILSVQANHERELFFILTARSLHLWYSRPTVEIVCHKRSDESIENLGLNKSAVWKIDSNVIVVATEKDQLLFFHVRRRFSPSSAATLLLPGPVESDSLYKLKCNSKNIENVIHTSLISRKEPSLSNQSELVPALTVYSFGKLDLSTIGVSCLMSADEELIVAARNGEIYGVHWNGNVDDKFPWSLANDVARGTDYVVDLKFSSVLFGFVLVFQSGRVGFMSSKSENKDDSNLAGNQTSSVRPKMNYLTSVDRVKCTDINHRYRLVALGLQTSEIIVCNINDLTSSLAINHKLKILDNKFPVDTSKLSTVNCVRYSPDGVSLVSSWEGGEFAVWSVFGSLLFCTLQWQLDIRIENSFKLQKISSLAWSQEGYNLWMSVVRDETDLRNSSFQNGQPLANGHSQSMSDDSRSTTSSLSDFGPNEEVIIVPFAHSNLPASPHLTCSSDCIVLLSENRLHIGPSVPHRAEFDHWFVVDIPKQYLDTNYPIRYACVDRQCKNIAIAGNRGFAIYSIDNSKWRFFNKKVHENTFSVCGDLIWWNDYIICSDYNIENEMFELRAYLASEPLDNNYCVVQPTSMEIIRMSIFENRLLVLYSDGTLGMFMLNLRRKPNIIKKPGSTYRDMRSNSIMSSGGTSENDEKSSTPRSTRSDSITSADSRLKSSPALSHETILQIAPIENLIISNLQTNAYCLSSIALTRLHFKNSRTDDSILLNACGKLFLLEREVPPSLSTPSPASDVSLGDLRELSMESNRSSDPGHRVHEAKRLSNSVHLVSASIRNTTEEPGALTNVTFKAVSVIATNVEQFWISPEISNASEMSFFKKSLWLSCGGLKNHLQVWLPLLNDKNDPPMDLYVPDRIMIPIKCDIYPLAIRSSTPDVVEPDDAIVLGAENDILYSDIKLFTYFPYGTIKRQCRVYLHRILRELLLNQHLGYYARKIAESCQSLPYFAHCFELLLHEVLEEEATSPVPLPDPMLPQIVRFIKEFPVYLETVVHCARKSELSMWSHLFDERAVGNPRRLFQECLEKNKLDIAASCLIILQSLDRNIISQRMIKQLIQSAKEDEKFNYLVEDLESFLSRAELEYQASSGAGSPSI